MTGKKYTIKEAAEISKMSESWWRQAILKNKVLYYKIGKKIFIPEETITGLYETVEPKG
jgi:hypothetical protein